MLVSLPSPLRTHAYTEHCDFGLQILNESAKMASINFTDHIATNFFPKTRQWIRLALQQQTYFINMEGKLVSSWVSLLSRAATDAQDIWDLLPMYTSLAEPPANISNYLEYLVATMQSLMGPLPVTDDSLRKHPHSYLKWLHLILTEFEAAQDAPRAPKLFTMSPQTSNNTHFIKITTTGLHK